MKINQKVIDEVLIVAKAGNYDEKRMENFWGMQRLLHIMGVECTIMYENDNMDKISKVVIDGIEYNL